MKQSLYAEALKPTVYSVSIALEPRRFVQKPDRITLERRADGQLWATDGCDERAVWVRRCFPWSKPTQYISLRDHRENEFALIRELNELDAGSRDALERALTEAGFVMQVTRILGIGEEVEIRNWKVHTRQGRRTFQTRLEDWPRNVPGGGILIRDVAGDLYHVEDPHGLDKKSRELLWAFVD
jgi:hypothetical protein